MLTGISRTREGKLTGITGEAPRLGPDGGHIAYCIEADGQGFYVKMTRNVGSDGTDGGSIFARDQHFHLHELIASLVVHGNLDVFFEGTSAPNSGFMSAVIEDILREFLIGGGAHTFLPSLSDTLRSALSNMEFVNSLPQDARDRILNDLPRAQDGTASQG